MSPSPTQCLTTSDRLRMQRRRLCFQREDNPDPTAACQTAGPALHQRSRLGPALWILGQSNHHPIKKERGPADKQPHIHEMPLLISTPVASGCVHQYSGNVPQKLLFTMVETQKKTKADLKLISQSSLALEMHCGRQGVCYLEQAGHCVESLLSRSTDSICTGPTGSFEVGTARTEDGEETVHTKGLR